jgi:hypothetical protein
MLQYPQMLSNLSYLQEGRAVSLVAVLLVAGVAPGVASALALALTVGMLVVAWRIARGPDGDRKAFGLVIIAALTSTPIVWEHYLVLLFIPVALASPRLSRIWLLPLCPPVIVVASAAIFPIGNVVGPHPVETLRSAIPCLLIEAVITGRLLLSDGQLSAFRDRLRARSATVQAARAVDLA